VENRSRDLRILNKNKVGRPYQYSTVEILAAFAIKCVFKLGYREASGMVLDFELAWQVKNSPNFRTIHWRIKKLKKSGIILDIRHHTVNDIDYIDAIIDSTGIKSRNDGEYRSTKYGKIKEWMKLHIVVDKKTRKILSIRVTRSNKGDTREFIPLLKSIKNKVRTVIADGAYDSEKNFEYCDKNDITPLIPVRINSKRGSRHRKRHVEEQLGLKKRSKRGLPKEIRIENQEKWKKESGYHAHSIVEGVFSVFKNAFGEYTFSKKESMKEKELMLKALVYNQFFVK
jgi:transposase